MKNLLFVSLASVALMGCGKGHANNPFSNNLGKDADTYAKAKEIQNTYQTECSSTSRKSWLSSIVPAVKGEKLPSSERTLVKFSGQKVTITEVHYLGDKCDGGEAYSFIEEGTVKVGDKDKNERNNAGTHIDFFMDTIQASILSAEGAKFANSYGLCSKKDWAEGVSGFDVTGVSSQANCYNVAPKRQIFNVYEVDDNFIYLGYFGTDAVSADQRPTTINAKLARKK